MTFGLAVNCIRKKATGKPCCSKAQSGLAINQDWSCFPSERDKVSSRATSIENGHGLLMFTPPLCRVLERVPQALLSVCLGLTLLPPPREQGVEQNRGVFCVVWGDSVDRGVCIDSIDSRS